MALSYGYICRAIQSVYISCALIAVPRETVLYVLMLSKLYVNNCQ